MDDAAGFAWWAPVYAEPVPGSGERVTVALAMVRGVDASLHRLTTDDVAGLPPLAATLNSVGPWLDALEATLKTRGEAMLGDGEQTLPGLTLGVRRKAVGGDLDRSATLAFRMTSMFKAKPRVRADERSGGQAASATATQLQSNSGCLSAVAEETSEESTAVTENLSACFQTVASALEEAVPSVGKTGRRDAYAATVSRYVMSETDRTDARVGTIMDAGQRKRDIVDLVQSFTCQINEMTCQAKEIAGNAIIEASRAGDPGRGFAVVASEVARITDEVKYISAQIAECLQTEVAQHLRRQQGGGDHVLPGAVSSRLDDG